MKSRRRGSLTRKLIAAFLLVSIVGVGLAGLLARWVTEREFDRFVMGQARSEYIANAAAWYTTHGSWNGVDTYLRRLAASSAPGEPLRPPQFALADQDGTVLMPVQPYQVGQRLPADLLGRAVPVEAGGRTVGLVVDVAPAPALSPQELEFLASTSQALLLAALAAAVVAVIVGILLARTLTRPLQDLTLAIEAMTGGQLRQQLLVRSSDELGLLVESFNHLSADLARAHDQRRQMTADIAHELRSPLTVLRAYIDGLADGTFQSTPTRLAAMQVEVDHLQHLVEDLRTLSLADAGQLPMQRILTSPAALLDRVAAAHAAAAHAAGITLATSAAPDLPAVLVDPDRLTQVLANLVNNALRYTPPAGTITLSAHQSGSLQPAWVVLTVQDTGAGIPAEALPFVFDRFYRADAARAQQATESGLGLAIAKSITEAHGGTIHVESEPGHGATFTVLLPAGNAGAAAV